MPWNERMRVRCSWDTRKQPPTTRELARHYFKAAGLFLFCMACIWLLFTLGD